MLWNVVFGNLDAQVACKRQMQHALTFDEWRAAAERLDQLEGNEEWKRVAKSDEYDYELVQNRLMQLKRARESSDEAAISFILRTSTLMPLLIRL